MSGSADDVDAVPSDPTADDEEKPDVSAGPLTGEQRNNLYEKGKKFMTRQKMSNALECFLRCVSGLTPRSGFVFLPQCLRKISEIYYGMEDYNKAVQFLQVEKMYYETALVDSSGSKPAADEMRSANGDDGPSAGTDDPLVIKAHEYEILSKLCLKQDRPELALEFCGKATQLYQKSYGESHDTTLKALDSFTVIYAEVGKRQYSDTIKKYKEAGVPHQVADLLVAGSEQSAVTKAVAEPSEHTGEPTASANATAIPWETGHLNTERSQQEKPVPLPKDALAGDGSRTEDLQAEEENANVVSQGQSLSVTGCRLVFALLITIALTVTVLLLVCESHDAPGYCYDSSGRLHYWYLIASYYYKQYLGR